MKRIVYFRIIKFMALVVPIVSVVLFSQYYFFCFTDNNTNTIHDFNNEEPNSLDVVFIGASDVYSGVAPAYAYEKYGFTSYIYTIANNTGALYKNMLKEVLKTQSPQLIFVELEGFLWEDAENFNDDSRLRVLTESIPMSLNKLEAIWQFNYDDKLSCLLPFIKYHGEWQNSEELWENYRIKTTGYDKPTLLKGMYTYTVVDESLHKYNIQNDTAQEDLLPLAENYLIDFLEYCTEEGIDNIIFVRFPHKLADESSYNRFCRSNKAGELIRQYGYDFFSFENMVADIGIDYEKDFYDTEHLNVRGQRKLTDYLGNLIIDKYELLPFEQSESNKLHWEDCVEYSKAFFKLGDEYLETGYETFMFDSLWFMTVLDEKVNNHL